MNICWKRMSVVLLGSVLFLNSYTIAGVPLQEYREKALFIERLARFIEWPQECLVTGPSDVFQITVFGDSPITEVLQQVYAKRKIIGRTVHITSATRVADIGNPHALFIAPVDSNTLHEVLVSVTGKPIMTLGETAGYAQAGVLINFYLYHQQVRFEINRSAMQSSGLKVDHRLGNLARIVATEKVTP